MASVSITLPRWLKEQLRQQADQQDCGVSALATSLLAHYLGANGCPVELNQEQSDAREADHPAG
jgi:hypothetical protein